MKNILKIIASDINRLSINVVAIIVIIGLSVLPCLYAWFNIISNWDPYGPEATGNLQVAVVSDDEGVVLGGLELNIGDKIISNLKENDTIGWVFTETSDEAIDGVHAGDYYACLVIEEDFSKNLISFLGNEMENPKIIYYENEKKNAIAPKITGKVKTTLQREVDHAFVNTLAGVLLSSSSAFVQVDSEGQLTNASIEKLKDLDNDMKAVVTILNSYIALMDSSESLMTATQAVSDSAQATMNSAEAMTEGADVAIEAASDAMDTSGKMINSAIDNSLIILKDVGELNTALLSVQELAAQETATAVAGIKETILNNYGLGNSGNNQGDNQGDNQSQTDAAAAILGALIKQTSIPEDLDNLEKAANKTSADTKAVNEAIKEDIEDCEDLVAANQAEYNNKVAPQIAITVKTANQAIAQTKSILKYDTSSLDAVAKSLKAYPDMMSQSKATLISARDEAAEMERKLAILTGNVESLSTDDKYARVATLLQSDPDYLADFIASPVNVSEQYIYPVENNGSAAAPFYIVLSIWVGSLIMSTILKTTVKDTTGMDNLKNWQCFFGRYFTTFVIGQIQTLITVLGALLYVGIQCQHPVLLWIACSWTSCVFSMLLYSFTYAFGNVGEALSVILMVIQVAGSGGTFPVEVLPKVFQYLYALMPFKYAMNACRECVAGMYQYDYWIDLLCLIPFVALAIVNGLFLFFPMRKLNHQIEKSKEKSGILI